MTEVVTQTPVHPTVPWSGSWLRRPMAAYTIAIVLVGAAFALRLMVPNLENEAPYIFFLPAVLISGVVGGFGPGLLATLLSLAIHVIGTDSYTNITPADVAGAAVFVIIGGGMAWFGERLKRAQHQAAAMTGEITRFKRFYQNIGFFNQFQ